MSENKWWEQGIYGEAIQKLHERINTGSHYRHMNRTLKVIIYRFIAEHQEITTARGIMADLAMLAEDNANLRAEIGGMRFTPDYEELKRRNIALRNEITQRDMDASAAQQIVELIRNSPSEWAEVVKFLNELDTEINKAREEEVVDHE